MQKRVELVDQLCLEFFKLFLAADLGISLPNIKRIFTVSVTPLTVFLVEIAVGLTARSTVLKRHSATLAHQLSRRAEKRVD